MEYINSPHLQFHKYERKARNTLWRQRSWMGWNPERELTYFIIIKTKIKSMSIILQ